MNNATLISCALLGLCLVQVHGAAPANDRFANAITVSGSSNTVSGSNVGATVETGEPYLYGGTKSVWWKWTPTASGTVTIDTIGSNFDTVLGVYVGSTVSTLTLIQQDDDSGGTGGGSPSKVIFIARAQTTYRICVNGWGSFSGTTAEGNITLRVRSVAPINDNLASAAAVDPYSTSFGSNVRGTKESGEPNHAGNTGGHSVWWTWNALHRGPVTIDTIGSSFDTLLAIYTGYSMSGLVPIASDNDSGSNGTSRVTFDPVYGTIYEIAVDGADGATGDISLKVTQQVVLPPNDMFANRMPLAGLSNNVNASLIDASLEDGEPNYTRAVYHYNDGFPYYDNYAYSPSLWWTWTPLTNGAVTIDTEGTTIANGIGIFTGDAVSNLTVITRADSAMGDDGVTRLSFLGIAGTTYQIAAYGINSFAGGDIQFKMVMHPSPPNDLFSNRSVLSGMSNLVFASLQDATSETNEPALYSWGYRPPSLWWTWSASRSGPVSLSATGMSYYGNPSVRVYTGDTVSNLTRIPDQSSGDNAIVFHAVAGTDYQIGIYGGGGGFGLSLQQGTSPTNDDFSGSLILTGLTNTFAGDSSLASPDILNVNPYTLYQGLWWSWTAPTSGVMRLETVTAAFNPVLWIYTGTAATNLVWIANADDYWLHRPALTFDAVAGTTYQIAVGASSGPGGLIDLRLAPVPPPLNDNFANRIPIPYGQTFVTGTNLGATLEPNEPSHGGYQRSIWWTWVAPATGPAVFNGSWTSELDVYTGNSLTTLSNVGPSFIATEGDVYQIALTSDYRNYGGSFAGAVGFSIALLNWTQGGLDQTNLSNNAISFGAQYHVSNAGYDTPVLRIRLLAVPGFSSTESSESSAYGALPLAINLGFFPTNGLPLAPGTAADISVAGVCPAPTPFPSGFGYGWATYAILEQQIAGDWLPVDQKFIFRGNWPTVNGFNGPGGGVVTIEPSSAGRLFNPVNLYGIAITGPAEVPEGSNATYYATAYFSDGHTVAFTNANWTTSLPALAHIGSNGALFVDDVTSNTVVALSASYSYGGMNYVGATNVTIRNVRTNSLEIVSQPVSQAVHPGDTATFAVEGTSRAHITYQWFHNGAIIPGETNAVLVLGNVGLDANGSYHAILASAETNAVSWDATLLVTAAPLIRVQPSNVVQISGSTVTFSTAADGAQIRYQWYFNSRPIPGATNAALVIANAAVAKSGRYSVVVSNAAGSVTGAQVTATIALPVRIAASPRSQSVVAGRKCVFTVAAAGTAPLQYQWRFSGAPIPGANQRTFAIARVSPSDAGQYDVVVSDAADSRTSSAAALTVLLPPLITQQPVDVLAAAGGRATFEVHATGTGLLQYQWFANGKKVLRATNAVLVIEPVQSVNAGIYRVLVRNKYGSAFSSNVQLAVAAAAQIAARSLKTAPALPVLGWSQTPGVLAISVEAGPGNYVIESSTDLLHWEPLRALTVGNAPVTIAVDPRAPTRFYRARSASELP